MKQVETENGMEGIRNLVINHFSALSIPKTREAADSTHPTYSLAGTMTYEKRAADIPRKIARDQEKEGAFLML